MRFRLFGILACAILAGFSVRAGEADYPQSLRELELGNACRLGIAVLDTGDGERLNFNADERFAMASTFKVLLAGAVLARVDAGEENLNRVVSYEEEDLLSYAPVTRRQLHEEVGELSVAELCEAAVVWSDNTAANLLLTSMGGPAGLTQFLRESGDETTRLDRMEPDLNANEPGDVRDTTTPAAMVGALEKFLLDGVLTDRSQELLVQWMIDCETGDQKLRAGLDESWRVGDKTGAGGRGASNDVAIVWPPGRDPILIAVFLSAPASDRLEQNSIIAQVGKIISDAFAE